MSYLKKILLISFSIIVSLVLFEGALGVVNYPYQSCDGVPVAEETEFDQDLGWKYTHYQTYTKSFGGTYSINQEGYRADSKEKKLTFLNQLF